MRKLYAVSLDLHTFDDCVDVVWGDFDTFVERYNVNVPDKHSGRVDGYHIERKGLHTIYIPDPLRLDILVHELVHYVMDVCNIRNIRFSAEEGDNEVFAYMMGSLMEQFLMNAKKAVVVRKSRRTKRRP